MPELFLTTKLPALRRFPPAANNTGHIGEHAMLRYLPRRQLASMGPQQSRMVQRPVRATSTLPHIVFEARGAMASQLVPCPGRCALPCRAMPCHPRLSPFFLPHSGSLFSGVRGRGWGGNETCPSLPQRETRAASRPQLPPHRREDQLSQPWPLPLPARSRCAPTQAPGCRAAGTGTSEPAPFLGKAPRDGAGRDHWGHVLNRKPGP